MCGGEINPAFGIMFMIVIPLAIALLNLLFYFFTKTMYLKASILLGVLSFLIGFTETFLLVSFC